MLCSIESLAEEAKRPSRPGQGGSSQGHRLSEPGGRRGRCPQVFDRSGIILSEPRGSLCSPYYYAPPPSWIAEVPTALTFEINDDDSYVAYVSIGRLPQLFALLPCPGSRILIAYYFRIRFQPPLGHSSCIFSR